MGAYGEFGEAFEPADGCDGSPWCQCWTCAQVNGAAPLVDDADLFDVSEPAAEGEVVRIEPASEMRPAI